MLRVIGMNAGQAHLSNKPENKSCRNYGYDPMHFHILVRAHKHISYLVAKARCNC